MSPEPVAAPKGRRKRLLSELFACEGVYASVKRPLPGLELVALAATATACGHSTATNLKIVVQSARGTEGYRLRCDPGHGTVPEPALTCRELRRYPKMLARTQLSFGSCPAPGPSQEAFHVSGTYRGRHLDAWFAGGPCFGIGDGKAWADWAG